MPIRRRLGRALTLALLLLPLRAAAQKRPEALWYLTSSEAGVQSFLTHLDRISVVAPQSFRLDSAGVVSGEVDPRVVRAAREHHIRLIPLVVNPGFDQAAFHRVLATPEVRARAVRNIARLCKDQGFDGIQFDFENINIADRDRFSAFFAETAVALHRVGCSISAAVVPRDSDFPGPTSYHVWMYENWRGAYDYKALADAGDFLSFMTYDQHTHRTPPGPVAGLPWMERALAFVLAQGVPPEKISLGIPAYSAWWTPAYDPQHGGHVSGTGLPYRDAIGLVRRNGAAIEWDDRQKAAFAAWENHGVNEFVYLEDARSFRAKLDLVTKNRLRGYSVWVLGFEDPAVWE